MAARKRKRGRKLHPGVVLIAPDEKARTHWRARYVDPATCRDPKTGKYDVSHGKKTKESLPRELTKREQAEAWAVSKSRELAEQRMEYARGAPLPTGTGLGDALKKYFAAHKSLRPNTLSSYQSAADKLVAWAAKTKLASADDLTRASLLEFRALVISERKRVPTEGGTRGEYEESDETRSPSAVNRDLRSVRAVLGYLGELDLLPRLADGDLRRALKRLPVTQEHIEYLKPAQLRKLLEAALRHDNERWKITREESAGLRPVGSTYCYDPISPFVAGVLLSGMRLDEALSLQFSQVDLDALDSTGRRVGEIHLKGAKTKTKKARSIGLEVSPALHTLLSALHLRSGGKGSVFGLSRGVAVAAAKRLRSEYGAPANFNWQTLRRSCGTYLTNAPGIFGGASVYQSARQLGHSTKIAEDFYLGRERGIPHEAHDLESAMQISDVLERVIARVAQGTSKPKLVALGTAHA